MFNTMIGKYFPGKSMIHNLNSKSKVICLFIFLITLFSNNYLVLSSLVFLTLILMFLSEVPLSLYFKSIWSLRFFLIFILILSLIFKESAIILIITLIKIIIVLIYTMILTYTTSKSELTSALESVFKPLEKIKVPVSKIALIITLALRFIPTIFEQTEKIRKSQASRGIDFFHGNLKEKIMAIKFLIVPTLILTINRSQLIADAMEIRLYGINSFRSNYRYSRWTNIDDTLIIIHLGILVYALIRMWLSWEIVF